MSKPGDLKWDELFKSNLKKSAEHVPSIQHPTVMNQQIAKMKSGPVNAPGEKPRQPTSAEIANYILSGMNKSGLRQATDEELFGHLVKSQEQVDAAHREWESKINDFYKAAKAPVDDQNSQENKNWGSECKSFNDSLTEEELIARNMYVNHNE